MKKVEEKNLSVTEDNETKELAELSADEEVAATSENSELSAETVKPAEKEDGKASSEASEKSEKKEDGKTKKIKKKTAVAEAMDWLRTICIGVLAGVLLVVFVIQRDNVYGDSMSPTLESGDVLHFASFLSDGYVAVAADAPLAVVGEVDGASDLREKF